MKRVINPLIKKVQLCFVFSFLTEQQMYPFGLNVKNDTFTVQKRYGRPTVHGRQENRHRGRMGARFFGLARCFRALFPWRWAILLFRAIFVAAVPFYGGKTVAAASG